MPESATIIEAKVPVIDYSVTDSQLSTELYKALTTVGFACLTNTGLWDKSVEYCQAAREFFAKPTSEKERYQRPPEGKGFGGWNCIGREQVCADRPCDYQESFNMYLHMRGDRKRAPELMDSRLSRELWDAFAKAMDRVAYAIGLALKLDDPHQIAKAHHYTDASRNRSALRTNFYPKLDNGSGCGAMFNSWCGVRKGIRPQVILYSGEPIALRWPILVHVRKVILLYFRDPVLQFSKSKPASILIHSLAALAFSNLAELRPGQLRCGEHTDYGSITLLYMSAPGLQIKHRQTGEFFEPEYIEGGMYLNIGDLLQRWSGDEIKADVHRVMNPTDPAYFSSDRFSVVFFAQADDDAVIDTLDGSGKYPTITSGQWLDMKFKSTYDLKK